MKVVLGTSPHVRHAAVLQADFVPDNTVMYSFAPVGLLSLAAMVRENRPESSCVLFDLNRRIVSGALPLNPHFYSAAAHELVSSDPDLIGLMTECDSYHHILQIAAEIKKIARKCAVVLGGPHASAVASQTMQRCSCVDAIVVGEGERSFLDLLDHYLDGKNTPVPGAIVRVGDRILDGGNRTLIESLDQLPVPAFDMYAPDTGEEFFVEVGRGCPFQCTFCSTAPYWKRRHRVKSPARVLRELRRVKELFGATRVHLTHDLFTTHRAWVTRVCETLIEAGTPMYWTCSARTDTVDRELLTLMARAGCNAIYFGIESGSPRILREIHKDIPLSQSFAMLEACREVGITPNAGFIAGFPTEDAVSLTETFSAYERAVRMGCRPTHMFVYCPFAGSSMYATLERLSCNGHFVDLPLGEVTDRLNRQRVSSDPELYGAYFRPDLRDLIPGEEGVLEALDEFSPLVEATLAPALHLARACGGLQEVFRRWLRWIHDYNDQRAAPEYRRGYGTVTAFSQFLHAELCSWKDVPFAALEVLRAIQTGIRVAQMKDSKFIMTMASHRSLALPAVEDVETRSLDTQFARGPVLASLALDYDITPALLGQGIDGLRKEPTYLVWHLTPNASIRLLRVDDLTFDMLESLQQPKSLAELILQMCRPRIASDGLQHGEVNPSDIRASILGAAREGLLSLPERHETSPHDH